MLVAAFERGRADALTRFGVKHANVPMAESPLSVPSFHGAMDAAGRGFSAIGRGVRSVGGGVRRALPLAALGVAGAAAYGLHQQNKRDREGQDLVYAPMETG